MKFFMDGANVAEIREAYAWGILDGVTTNPSLVAKEGRPFREVIEEICSIVPGPVSAECVTLDADSIVAEARELAAWAPNVVVKVPLMPEGMKAVKILSAEGIKTNVTVTFQAAQGLIAAKAGATYVSPFVGRLDDRGHDGMEVVEDIVRILDNYGFETQVIVASIRGPNHVIRGALCGAHVATMPFAVMKQLFQHPLTDLGIQNFLADWEKLKAKLGKSPA